MGDYLCRCLEAGEGIAEGEMGGEEAAILELIEGRLADGKAVFAVGEGAGEGEQVGPLFRNIFYNEADDPLGRG